MAPLLFPLGYRAVYTLPLLFGPLFHHQLTTNLRDIPSSANVLNPFAAGRRQEGYVPYTLCDLHVPGISPGNTAC